MVKFWPRKTHKAPKPKKQPSDRRVKFHVGMRTFWAGMLGIRQSTNHQAQKKATPSRSLFFVLLFIAVLYFVIMFLS